MTRADTKYAAVDAIAKSLAFVCLNQKSAPIYRSRILLALAMIVFSGCAHVEMAKTQPDSVRTALFFWQDETLSLIKKYQLNPLRAARALAYVHKGMYEASATIEPSLTTRAACTANNIDYVASRLLSYLFPLETPGKIIAKAEMRKSRKAICIATPTAAAEIYVKNRDAAALDGAFPPRKLRSNPAPQIGSWQATAPIFATIPSEPFAGQWKLFLVAQPSALTLPPPLAPESDAYAAQLNEVIETGKNLTPEQRLAAEFWHLDAGSATPPGVWNMKLRALLEQQPDVDVSKLLAVFNMAMYDAMVVCWRYKYVYWTQRPITANQRLTKDNWTPLLVTPPFPSYPSGHATVSAAAARVIASYMPKHAVQVQDWAIEAASSRLWGGIHFRFDNDAGLALGAQVGAAAIAAMPPSR